MSSNDLKNLINKCKSAGGETMYQCVKQANEYHNRTTTDSKNKVYPWINYDWDYTTYIDNNYNSDATGASPKGNWKNLFANPKAMIKIAKGFITEANPSKKSKAGDQDQLDCNAVEPHNKASCNAMKDIRHMYRTQQKPKNTPFFNQKLDGKKSSSYYYQTGYCISDKINNETDCVNSQGKWFQNLGFGDKGGKCYKNRYALIKNEPGIDFKKFGDNALTKIANFFGGSLEGNAVSVVGDLMSFSPNNLIDIVNLKNTRDFILEPCIEYMTGNYKEHFNHKESKVFYKTLAMFAVLCLLIMSFITITYRIIK
jgi:hypothetical protein